MVAHFTSLVKLLLPNFFLENGTSQQSERFALKLESSDSGNDQFQSITFVTITGSIVHPEIVNRCVYVFVLLMFVCV